jgi:hypothetical protein
MESGGGSSHESMPTERDLTRATTVREYKKKGQILDWLIIIFADVIGR